MSSSHYTYSVYLPMKGATVLGIFFNFVVMIVTGLCVARFIHVEENLTSWFWTVAITCAILVLIYVVMILGEFASRARKIKGLEFDVLYGHATKGLFTYLTLGVIFTLYVAWEMPSTTYPDIYLANIITLFFLGSCYLIVDTLFNFTAKGNEDRRIADAERSAASP